MYIKEVTLEGFKSYAQRTVVPGFDPLFNAITGLNGSGKSNILDSICFVLGITKLEQVRASNLQELVYKQGQAGITKATVSIVFDNSDCDRSPIGYQDTHEITVSRQIVVGGRNKYLINGKVASPGQVQNLFHSVQLNVNNPHFLIMQGRITKVLSMKPPEILSMLEEAAGTKMYESKKEVALKTLEKKQSKVDDIDNLLGQDILPALEKLRKERAQYQQWTSGNGQVDRLRRFCIAYEFSEAEKIKEAAVDDVKGKQTKATEVRSTILEVEKETEGIEITVKALTEAKEKQMNSDFKLLVESLDALSTTLVKLDSACTNKKETFDAEKSALVQQQKDVKDLETSIVTKIASERQAENDLSGLREKVALLQQSLDTLERDYQAIQAGKGSGADEKSLADQLADANALVGKAETVLKQTKTKMHHLDEELKDKQKQLRSKKDEANAVQQELQSRKTEMERLKAALDGLGYQEGQMECLQQKQKDELEILKRLKTEISNLTGQLHGVEFSYKDPEKGFKQSRVKGVVARLIHVKESAAMTALEVVAGGKLYNVVVDTEKTAKLLLEKGGLHRRVTIIPLNKIQAHTIPSRTLSAAGKLVGPANARPALSLVGYPEGVETAMAYAFGGAFVCSNTDVAKQVAFHKDILTKSVSLLGDVFEPRGLLTGGSRSRGGELLMHLHALAQAEANLAEHACTLSKVEAEISTLTSVYKKYTQLKSQLELKSYDLSLFESRAQQSEHHKLSEVVAAMVAELQSEKLDIVNKEEHHKECKRTVVALELKIKEHGRDREMQLKTVEKDIKSTKKELSTALKDLKGHDVVKERLLLEKEAAIQEKAVLEKQVCAGDLQLKTMEAEIADMEAKRDLVRADYLKVKEDLSQNRQRMKECDVQIAGMVKSQNKLKQKVVDYNVEIKKLENEIKRMETNHQECAKLVERLLEKYEWIAKEKQLFGKSGTDYDFRTHNPQLAQEELKAKQAEQANIEKRINKKALAMFDKAEEEYNDLIERKRIVQNDKAKIEQVIKELDEKRKEQLKTTWEKVNKELGSIFSTLLPGTMAKLDPPEGCDFMSGLEVRVAFGTVWKQSLSELSGGQRSLLALSLILALLLFKPAPLYILDEVDAALDLSHTQNIGRMIKSHFPHSQFIVVSLKEGMFNNANVLFRTKFVDGISTVSRTMPGIREK